MALTDPLKEAQRLVAACKTEKQKFQTDFSEAYSFTMPHRVRPGTTSKSRPNDAAENFISIGTQVAADFASDIADTFMPEHTPWASAEITSLIPEDIAPEAKAMVKADTDATFAAISASNFYDAVKMGCMDLSVSAFGLVTTDPGAGQPIHCKVVPLTELLILRSSRGGIGTRFWEQTGLTTAELLENYTREKLPKNAAAKSAKDDVTFTLVQGCWRDYTTPAEIAWHCIAYVDDELIEYVRVTGEGSEPMQVCRWAPDATFAWGIGPAINALPDFRTGDEIAYQKLKALAKNISPPLFYDDDGVMNLAGGVTNDSYVARLHGSEMEYLETKNGIDAAVYSEQDIEHRIRRHYYLDEPEQRGKTPPTLGQWADESLRRQRRLATPAAPLWPEFLAPLYQRFRYLLVKNGTLPPIKVGGKAVQLRPVNPLKRAAMQEEAVASERFLGTLAAFVPPGQIPMVIDVGATAHRMQDLGNAGGVVLKKAKEINTALDQAQQMAMAQAAAATAGSAAPAVSAIAGATNGAGGRA